MYWSGSQRFFKNNLWSTPFKAGQSTERHQKLHKAKTRPRLPITIDILCMLISFLPFSCFGRQDDLMHSAVVTLAFYGFLRCGEFTVPSGAAYSPLRHLSMQDVVFYPSFYNPTYMTVHFKYSKTDPFRKGHVVTLHVTNTLTSPVRTMKQYLETRTFDLYSPLFLLADGSALTCCQFIRFLHSLLEKVGLQVELYADHSFHIGRSRQWDAGLQSVTSGIFRLQIIHYTRPAGRWL